MKIVRNFNGVFVNGYENTVDLITKDKETQKIFGDHYFTYAHNGQSTQCPTLTVRGDDDKFHEHIIDIYLFKYHRNKEGFEKIKEELRKMKEFFRACFSEEEEYFSLEDDETEEEWSRQIGLT